MVDALCMDDLDRFGTELDDPLAELDQDLYHRLIEPWGSNLDDPDRGYGLEGQLSRGGHSDDLFARIRTGIELELGKDERVHNVQATVTSDATDSVQIAIQIVADEGVLGITLVADGAGVRRVA